MLAIKLARALAGVFACSCVLGAAPAVAEIDIDAFSLTPEAPPSPPTQAGANPDLNALIKLSSSPAAPDPGADDVRNLTLSLAPGLLANLTAVETPCSEAQMDADSCPAGSRVGSGFVDARMEFPFFSELKNVPAKLYLVEPRAGEAARAGIVAGGFGITFAVSGPITVRTTPSAGLDLTFKDILRTVPATVGSPIELHRLDLTIDGTVADKPFTRNPTACGTATTKLTASSYAGDTDTAQSGFTPTGCSSLAFAPQISGVARAGSGLSLGVRTTITQAPGQAALKRTELVLPPFISPRLSVLTRTCGTSDPAACPSSSTVGGATVISPLLASPLEGRVVLRKGSPLPGLALVFPPPVPLKLEGKVALTAQGLKASFDKLPDVPLSKLEVDFSGGSDSLLTRAGVCLTGAILRGSFGGHNGKAATDSSPMTVTGCPFPRPTASVSLRNLAGTVPVLRLVVKAPEAAGSAGALGIDRVSMKLPRGLKLNKRKLRKRIALRLDGKRGAATRRASSKRLRLRLKRDDVKRVAVKIKGRALRVSPALKRKIRRSRARKLKFIVKVRYAGDGTFTLRPRARPR